MEPELAWITQCSWLTYWHQLKWTCSFLICTDHLVPWRLNSVILCLWWAGCSSTSNMCLLSLKTVDSWCIHLLCFTGTEVTDISYYFEICFLMYVLLQFKPSAKTASSAQNLSTKLHNVSVCWDKYGSYVVWIPKVRILCMYFKFEKKQMQASLQIRGRVRQVMFSLC